MGTSPPRASARDLAILVALALLLLPGWAAAQSLRVLFVGNSYTAGGSLGSVPDLVQRMATAAGEPEPLVYTMVAPGGFTLERHWNNEVGTRTFIAQSGWDWVVLQEQSTRPIDQPQLFYQYARLLDADIHQSGAETIFYLTWARSWAPGTQLLLNDAYCAMVDELRAAVSPVGMAWRLSLGTNPSMTLHGSDGSHANARGQYLTGLVFFRTLYHRSPVGLPHDVSPMVDVTPEEAAYLQSIAAAAPYGCPGDPIFADGFASGSTTAWSATVP